VIAPNAGAESGQFLSGKVAILQGGDWFITPIQAGAKFSFGIAANPTGPAGQLSTINAGAVSIAKTSKHPEQAWELVKYLTSPAGQKAMAASGTHQPALSDPALTKVWVDTWAAKSVDVSAFTLAGVGKTFPVASGPNINAVQTATDAAVASIYLNTSSVKDALDKAQTAAMAAYKGNN
jgi:multiple sugar transport system substrate-binding protein